MSSQPLTRTVMSKITIKLPEITAMSINKSLCMISCAYVMISLSAIVYCISIGGHSAPWRALLLFVIWLPLVIYAIAFVAFVRNRSLPFGALLLLAVVAIMAVLNSVLLHSVSVAM